MNEPELSSSPMYKRKLAAPIRPKPTTLKSLIVKAIVNGDKNLALELLDQALTD